VRTRGEAAGLGLWVRVSTTPSEPSSLRNPSHDSTRGLGGVMAVTMEREEGEVRGAVAVAAADWSDLMASRCRVICFDVFTSCCSSTSSSFRRLLTSTPPAITTAPPDDDMVEGEKGKEKRRRSDASFHSSSFSPCLPSIFPFPRSKCQQEWEQEQEWEWEE